MKHVSVSSSYYLATLYNLQTGIDKNLRPIRQKLLRLVDRTRNDVGSIPIEGPNSSQLCLTTTVSVCIKLDRHLPTILLISIPVPLVWCDVKTQF